MHTVAEYAGLLHRSPKTISNIFTKTGDRTPLQIIQARRMLEARRMLRYTDLPVSEVAFSLGFEDLQTFSRFFKGQDGVSPSEFRAKTKSGRIANPSGSPAYSPRPACPHLCVIKSNHFFIIKNRKMTQFKVSKLRAFFASLAFVAFLFSAQAQNVLTDENGVAAGGFDVTTYFQNAPTTGNPAFTAIYDGAIYRFVSVANRDVFKADPAKYAPQYGGYCAFAVGKMNAKVPINPTTYKITDGKLYLFFNDLYEGKPLNTLELWNGDEKGLLPLTNANWAKMTAKK